MAASRSPLFAPLQVKSLALANRIVMAPMTRNHSPGGVPGSDVVEYYRRRAAHGVGLIITEGTVIAHPAASSNPRVPRFHGEDALSGWARVSQAVHQAGGKIIPQLWHVGAARKPGSEPNPEAPPVGPSGLDLTGAKLGEPLTDQAVADLIEAYAGAAGDAKRLGFDGIELHGAHGYLIDQFFWQRTNRRDDRYGGDAVGRTRFAVEIVKACRRRTSPDFPIVLRFSAQVPWAEARRVTLAAPDGKGPLALVEALPQTGRTHQVRVHLADAGFPLAVDPGYGDAGPLALPGGLRLERTPLHAERLGFVHPASGASIEVQAPLAADLAAAVAALRGLGPG